MVNNREKFNEYRRRYFKTQVGRAKLREQQKRYRRTPVGRANHTWFNILGRAGKKKGYENVEVKMTKEQFIEWAIPRYASWFENHPTITPSINRIDPNGHYEIFNIEMISIGENARLARTVSKKPKKAKRGWFIDGLGI